MNTRTIKGLGTAYENARYVDIMPLFAEKGLVSIHPSKILEARANTEYSKAEKENLNNPWNLYFDTDFGVIGTEDKIYFLPESKRLRAVTPDSRVVKGGLKPTDSDIEEAKLGYDGEEFEQFLNKQLKQPDFENPKNPIRKLWLPLAGTEDVLNAFAEKAYKYGKDIFGYDEMLGFYVSTDRILRGFVLGRLSNRADADGYGRDLLGCGGARLVGVPVNVAEGGAPEKQKLTLEQLLAISEGLVCDYAKNEYEARARKLLGISE